MSFRIPKGSVEHFFSIRLAALHTMRCPEAAYPTHQQENLYKSPPFHFGAMGKKGKDKKNVHVQKYTPLVSKDERLKQIGQIQAPELEKQFVRENEGKFEHWRPLWRNDWLSIAEKRRLKNRQHRPKRSKKRVF